MRNFLKSLFGRGGDPSLTSATESAPQAPVEPVAEAAGRAAAKPARAIVPAGTLAEVLTELTSQVCETMPDPREPEEIDVELHMYDAGYVTSITAADLLAHIDERYGLDISETKLIGPLQNLAALAAHIHQHAPSQ
ncbi:MAG: acyl carrier protein [Myxococcota bacterium]|nr:acyl carrier protein [Myxococcota bacterium]